MANPLPVPLEVLQSICKEVESEVLKLLLQYEPCQNMIVGDVKYIARLARDKAFQAFDREISHG